MLISSDSDDDSPDMILKRLERNKRQLRAEQNPSEYNSTIGNILNTGDDVILVSDTCDNRERISRSLVNNSTNDVIFVSESTSACKSSTVNDITNNYDSTDLFLNNPVDIVATRARGKRKKALDDTVVETRGKRGRGGKKGVSNSVSTPRRGRGRGRGGKSSTRTPVTLTTVLIPTRGRGRGRGRQKRGATSNNSPIGLLPPVAPRSTRRRQSNRVRTSIPIYSIGNTDEYPDASDHISLFNNIPEKPPVNDLDISLDNEEVSVKVLWRSVEVFPFQIRKLQKLTKIFDFFSEREGVPKDNLLFMYNNKILSPDDTPESIEYSFVKFIDGGITSTGLSLPQAEPKKIKHGFRLKFQCQGIKNPYVVAVGREEKLQLALIKCAEHLEIPISNLKFEFDGEIVRGNLSAKDMDMESGDCIDVKILNVNK